MRAVHEISARSSAVGRKDRLTGLRTVVASQRRAEIAADGLECEIDLGRKSLHRSHSPERDDGHYQSVLHQVLSVFTEQVGRQDGAQLLNDH